MKAVVAGWNQIKKTFSTRPVAGTTRERRSLSLWGTSEPITFDLFLTLALGDLKATLLETSEDISDHRAIQIIVPQD